MNNYLQLETNIGLNTKTYSCMAIHPSEMHMFYAVGSLLVVKSVDYETDRYLPGHQTIINYITVSNSGNLVASGESFEQGYEESAALIVWDFNQMEILYRVKYHKNSVMSLSFNCDDGLLASVGGTGDGNQLVLWNMEQGKSEVFQAASDKPDQGCTDICFFRKNPLKFVTAHSNTIKIWEYDFRMKRLKHFECPLGQVKRYIVNVTIDGPDAHAYCGTRSGDILEISLDKGIF